MNNANNANNARQPYINWAEVLKDFGKTQKLIISTPDSASGEDLFNQIYRTTLDSSRGRMGPKIVKDVGDLSAIGDFFKETTWQEQLKSRMPERDASQAIRLLTALSKALSSYRQTPGVLSINEVAIHGSQATIQLNPKLPQETVVMGGVSVQVLAHPLEKRIAVVVNLRTMQVCISRGLFTNTYLSKDGVTWVKRPLFYTESLGLVETTGQRHERQTFEKLVMHDAPKYRRAVKRFVQEIAERAVLCALGKVTGEAGSGKKCDSCFYQLKCLEMKE